MSFFVGAFTLLISTSCILPATLQSQRSSSDRDDYIKDNNVAGRTKRSLPGIIIKLLKKTTLEFWNRSLKVYKRSGGYDKAVKDFYDLDPKISVDRPTHKRGLVGDRDVYFQFRYNRATIRIFGRTPNIQDSVQIKYTD